MANAADEAKQSPVRVAVDRRIKLDFRGARITSDGGLLSYRELHDALGLTAMVAAKPAEGRHGKNIRHQFRGLLRQVVYSRLAGYEDVNDAERLARDPAMRAIVRREDLDRPAIWRIPDQDAGGAIVVDTSAEAHTEGSGMVQCRAALTRIPPRSTPDRASGSANHLNAPVH